MRAAKIRFSMPLRAYVMLVVLAGSMCLLVRQRFHLSSTATSSTTLPGTPQQPSPLRYRTTTNLPSASWYEGAWGYAEARREQQTSQSPLVVYFYTDWCSYCRSFNRDFLPSPEVQDFLSHTVKVRINPEEGAAEEAISKLFGVSGYPAIFVTDGTTAFRQVYPFKPSGETWVATSPSEFAHACYAAASVTAF